jgi:hypothetical protein
MLISARDHLHMTGVLDAGITKDAITFVSTNFSVPIEKRTTIWLHLECKIDGKAGLYVGSQYILTLQYF